MTKFNEFLGTFISFLALVLAFLVLFYGDNWFDWHPKNSSRSEESIGREISKNIAEPSLNPLNSENDNRNKPVKTDIIIQPILKYSQPEIERPQIKSEPQIKRAQDIEGISDKIRKITRDSIVSTKTIECESKVIKQSNEIIELIRSASIAQNQFYNTNNSKAMISDLNKWLVDVEKFINQNKENLPDTKVFVLANPSGNFGTFHREGTKAWATMDVKRKALEVIVNEIRARPCKEIGKAALADCDDDTKCSVSN